MTSTYASVADARASLLLETGEPQSTIDRLLDVASRRIDEFCDRSFAAPVEATRTYRCAASSEAGVSEAAIGDLQALPAPTVSVAASSFADADEWTTLDAADVDLGEHRPGWPVTHLRLRGRCEWVRITGQFGWQAVPPQIRRATLLLVARLYRREQSPLTTAASGGDLGETSFTRYDPDFLALAKPFRRLTLR